MVGTAPGGASRRARWLWRALLLALAVAAAPTAAAEDPAGGPAAARELLDAGRVQEAAALLDRWLASAPGDAGALLLRSTARFVLGEMESGRGDLERALELDPTLRQGWLNRAALDLAEERHDEALEAFRRAEALDPGAADNSLNIGAVLLLQGQLGEASQRFQRYLEDHPGSADASYLVASNYAMAGYAGVALGHLRRAVELDERSRLRARNDPNFEALAANTHFQRLLLTDGYTPPPGAHRAARRFEVAYRGGNGPLLEALLDALQLSGRPFDPRIEVTPDWALVWSDLRIKILSDPEGARLELSAPATSFTPDEWRRVSEGLFRQVAIQLVARRQPASGR